MSRLFYIFVKIVYDPPETLGYPMADVHQLLRSLMEEIGPQKAQDVPSISKLLRKWIWESKRFRSMKTIGSYGVTATYIRASKPKGQHLKRCNSENLKQLSFNFKDFLDTKKLSTSSKNSYLINLQTFYNWLKTEGHIPDRIGVPKIKVSEKSIKAYTGKQMDDIKRQIKWRMENATGTQKGRKKFYQHHLRSYYMARYSGFRCGEILNLKLSDIVLEKREIWVRDSGDLIVKGAKEESVPMSNKLFHFLKYDLKRSPLEVWYLDTGFGNRAYAKSLNLTNAMKPHLRALGISGVKPMHGFRAAFCRNLGLSGAPLPILKDLMRHRNLETTLRYMDIHGEDQKLKAVNQLV